MKVAVVVGVCIGGAICLCIVVSALLFFILRSRHGKQVAESHHEKSVSHDHWPTHLSASVLSAHSLQRLSGADIPNPSEPRGDDRSLLYEAGTDHSQAALPKTGPRPSRALGTRKWRKARREAPYHSSKESNAISFIVQNRQRGPERPGRTLTATHRASYGDDIAVDAPSDGPARNSLRGVSPVPPYFPALETHLTDLANINPLSENHTRKFSAPNMTPQSQNSPTHSRPSTAIMRSASVGGYASGVAPTTSLPPLPVQVNRESVERPMSYGSFMSDDTAASSVLWDGNGAMDRAAEIAHAPAFATIATPEELEYHAETQSVSRTLQQYTALSGPPDIIVPESRQDSSYAVLSQGSFMTNSRQSTRASDQQRGVFGTEDLDHHVRGINSLAPRPSARSRTSSKGSPIQRRRRSEVSPSDRPGITEPLRGNTQTTNTSSSNLSRNQEIPGTQIPSSPSLVRRSIGSANSHRQSLSMSPTPSSPVSPRTVQHHDREGHAQKGRQISHKKPHGITPWSSGTSNSTLISSPPGADETTKQETSASTSGLAPAKVSTPSSSLSDNNGYWTPAATTSSAEQHFEFPEIDLPRSDSNPQVPQQSSFGPRSDSLSSKSRPVSSEPIVRTRTPPPQQRQSRRSTARDHVPPVPTVPFIRFKPSRSTPLSSTIMPRYGPPNPKHRSQFEHQRTRPPTALGTVPRSYPTPALLYSAQELRRMNSEALGDTDVSNEEQMYMHIGRPPSRLSRASDEPAGDPWFSFRNRQHSGQVSQDKESETHAVAGAESTGQHPDPDAHAARFWVNDTQQAARDATSSARTTGLGSKDVGLAGVSPREYGNGRGISL